MDLRLIKRVYSAENFVLSVAFLKFCYVTQQTYIYYTLL